MNDDDAPQDRGKGELANALGWLMENTLDDNGRKMTAELVAYRAQSQGISCSAAYINHLRSGRRSTPSADVLTAIGQAGGVPIQYFTDPQVRSAIQADGAMPAEKRRDWIDMMVYVASKLTAEERAELINELRRKDNQGQ